ncbi:hypothetical protein [Hyphomonas sp.]
MTDSEPETKLGERHSPGIPEPAHILAHKAVDICQGLEQRVGTKVI